MRSEEEGDASSVTLDESRRQSGSPRAMERAGRMVDDDAGAIFVCMLIADRIKCVLLSFCLSS